MTDVDKPVVEQFSREQLQQFSDLLNRLGSHGFKRWPESAEDLEPEMEALRVDPESGIVLLRSGDALRGYGLVILEPDIGRAVVSIAAEPGYVDALEPVLNALIAKVKASEIPSIHVAAKSTPVEPLALIEDRGAERIQANLELKLDRRDASNIMDVELAEGFSIRPMRSSVEVLRLTQLQNSVFAKHWGFSQNSPEEIQSKLDLPVTGPEHVLFCESPEGDLAGYVWTAVEWRDEATVGKIWMTGIAPQFRKSGLGNAIVTAGVKHLLAQGAAVLELEVLENNPAAVRIYEGLGFVTTGRTDWYELKV